MDTPLHTFHDGSTLCPISAKELINIPVWKGNRILDTAHATAIQQAIKGDVQQLDSGYRIVQYNEEDAGGNPIRQSYLIDGQHRAHVLRTHFQESLCESDFTVLMTVKQVEDEEEAIAFFNAVNNCKPQIWRLEPNLILNKYIGALTKQFNANKKLLLLRPGSARRPYLSTDKLRESLRIVLNLLKQEDEEVLKFVNRVNEWNKRAIREAEVHLSIAKKADVSMLEKCICIDFMLSFDSELKWIVECLAAP